MEKEASWRNRDHFLSLSLLYHKTSYDSTVFFHKTDLVFYAKPTMTFVICFIIIDILRFLAILYIIVF